MKTIYVCGNKYCSFMSEDRTLVEEHERTTLHHPCTDCHAVFHEQTPLTAHMIEAHDSWTTAVVRAFFYWLDDQEYNSDAHECITAFIKALRDKEVPEWN